MGVDTGLGLFSLIVFIQKNAHAPIPQLSLVYQPKAPLDPQEAVIPHFGMPLLLG
jgi:hypothetical protein